jgi:uncharacterized membrane protein
MAKSDGERFFDALAFLAVTTQYQIDEITMRGYRTALDGIPVAFIERACAELAREPRRWFPMAADIRERAEKIARAGRTTLALPPGATSTGYACVDCKDTGWKYVDNRAVTECECRPTNPNYQAAHPRSHIDWSEV